MIQISVFANTEAKYLISSYFIQVCAIPLLTEKNSMMDQSVKMVHVRRELRLAN